MRARRRKVLRPDRVSTHEARSPLARLACFRHPVRMSQPPMRAAAEKAYLENYNDQTWGSKRAHVGYGAITLQCDSSQTEGGGEDPRSSSPDPREAPQPPPKDGAWQSATLTRYARPSAPAPVRHNRCWLRAERSVSSGQMESGRRGRRDPEPTPLLGRRARVHHGTYPAQTCRLVDQSSGRHSEPSSMRVD